MIKDFSAHFPVTKINTGLTLKDIAQNIEIEKHFETLKGWISNNASSLDPQHKLLQKGFRVLLCGPSKTTKTSIAGMLGNETGKEVYRIDTAMVMSRYIGETEKNLKLLFAGAENGGSILFFDEADALFGKRTGVKDAHDRYASQESSYLLQQMEDFNGFIILATNSKKDINGAFIKKLNGIIDFCTQEEDEKEKHKKPNGDS